MLSLELNVLDLTSKRKIFPWKQPFSLALQSNTACHSGIAFQFIHISNSNTKIGISEKYCATQVLPNKIMKFFCCF